MKNFDALVEIANRLHGPGGCPWDRKQTFQTLRSHVLEEVHELLEAIDDDAAEGMVEELGDILFQIIFFAKIGEKTGRYSLEEIINTVSEKLIRRHPHVFGESKVKDAAEVEAAWERIKKEEKKERTSFLDGIPRTLNALARAQKVVKRMIRKELPFPKKEIKQSVEEGIGDQFLALVIQAEQEGVDAESALRVALKKCETLFKS